MYVYPEGFLFMSKDYMVQYLFFPIYPPSPSRIRSYEYSYRHNRVWYTVDVFCKQTNRWSPTPPLTEVQLHGLFRVATPAENVLYGDAGGFKTRSWTISDLMDDYVPLT